MSNKSEERKKIVLKRKKEKKMIPVFLYPRDIKCRLFLSIR